MKLTLHLTALRPMLQHNGRLANPLDPYTRAMKPYSKKRTRTDEDILALMQIESRGSAWETSEGLLGLPTQAVWRCIFDAAKAYKQGQNIKRALIGADTIEPLLVGGQQVMVDDFLSSPENIDFRAVRVNGGSRTMRARPIVREWSSTIYFELLEDVIDARDLAPILERAGRLVGLGDWRPIYGTFTTEVQG